MRKNRKLLIFVDPDSGEVRIPRPTVAALAVIATATFKSLSSIPSASKPCTIFSGRFAGGRGGGRRQALIYSDA